MSPPFDPKNYYGVLGVPADADLDAIKAAFRARAKRLHPDHNDSPDAEAEFRLLNEAYRVLGDPERRRRYHAGTDRRRPRPEPPPSETPPPRPAPPPRAEAAPEAEREPPPRARFHACRVCGTLSAQPRVVSFREVGGRPFAATRRSIAGVFCPRCAEKTAVQASLHTWVRGLTALPKGTLWAFPALFRNLMGGEMPVEANARLLLSQARAFLGKGDVDLARASVAQALPFAARTAFRHEAETLLSALGGTKELKSRWPRFGRAFRLQLLPFIGIAAIFVLAVTVSLHRTAPPPPREVPALPPVQALVALPDGPSTPLPSYVVKQARIALYGGPGRMSPVLAWAEKGTPVTMTALVPGDTWVQVRLPDGRLGFVELDDLK
jgi:hypothetical protein